MLLNQASAFFEFMRFCDWLFEKENRRHGIALTRLFERVFDYLVLERGMPPQSVAETLWEDYTRSGRRDRPAFLREYDLPAPTRPTTEQHLPARQSRHL
jgi:hypothetical protein